MPETRTTSITPVTGRRLWAGLLVAPLAWLVTGGIGYLLVARSCEPGTNGLNARGLAKPGLVLVVLSISMLVLASTALWSARGSYRIVRSSVPSSDAGVQRASGAEWPRAHAAIPAWGRARFMALAGILVSALFLLGIAFFVIPPFLVVACTQAH